MRPGRSTQCAGVPALEEAKLEDSVSRRRCRAASGAAPGLFGRADLQDGGYCAWAVSKDYTYSADPEAWRIVGGKLYLNYSKDVQRMWQEELPQVIDRADKNWPAVLEKPAK